MSRNKNNKKKVYHKRAKNGYIYTLNKTYNETEYWICASKNCSASLVQKGSEATRGRKGWDTENQHSAHLPDHDKCEAEIAVGAAKEMAMSDPLCKTAEIWDKATQNLSLQIQPLLPAETQFKDNIRKIGRAHV